MGDKVGENPAALRAAVFLLSSKNLRGGAFKRPPPPAGRGLIDFYARIRCVGEQIFLTKMTIV